MKNNNRNLFIEKLNKHYGWLIFIFIVTTISGLFTIVNGVRGVVSIYRDTLGKNNAEEKIINQLSPLVNISYFKDKLGAEIIKRPENKGMTQYIFKRYNYFVQAITDNSDTVLFWSITSCNPKRPFKVFPNEESKINNKANNIDNLNNIVLHRSTFNSIFSDLKDMNPKLFYFLSGATANSYAVESYYGANPGGYQTIYIGINDACSNEIKKMYDYSSDLFMKEIDGEDWDKVKTPQLLRFRAVARINLYGESAPLFNIDDMIKNQEINVGIDRLMIRILR